MPENPETAGRGDHSPDEPLRDVLAIVGSRTLSPVLELPEGPRPDLIISGGAIGVDTSARNLAQREGIAFLELLPNYQRWGRWVAPLERNTQIAKKCTRMVAIWDGESRGTRDVVAKARNLGKPVTVISPQELQQSTVETP